ncbi:TetR/AcrR family transcriptional regulator [Paenibacillus polymyxa]|uniref:TetR/AcrR family transcriptional regulator n=1 Tax=Paenibacillus polymyxa TaxID=1406 RepID=UPI0025B63C13|nr:TetR/AcrR family transcriptional regulator [Paenibacillus polymyxa]MDN4084477.1 TetR/AcrR family transcriptional regulator [Paenibacillus polymyxa]MDN4090108.1 TetR/AcrR family transcriptional regulator [Paenibacillus polymyxa]MDN4110889.1 TetR/AcrR family transcriptional regulator [Paenibacillus polymyxa]
MRSKNKEIQRKRIIEYFIEATQSIIEKDGVENVTIRGVSSLAGYNSATLYNYFDNLNQLISFSLINSVLEYFVSLSNIITSDNKSYITFLLTWREYAIFSFQKPEMYTHIFYSKYSDDVLSQVACYLELFPNPNFSKESEIQKRILGASIEERDNLIADPCIKDGYIDNKDKKYIFDFCYALHLGMCAKIKSGDYKDPYEVTELYLDYLIDFLLNHSKIPCKKSELLEYILNYK